MVFESQLFTNFVLKKAALLALTEPMTSTFHTPWK